MKDAIGNIIWDIDNAMGSIALVIFVFIAGIILILTFPIWIVPYLLIKLIQRIKE